jgi:hypothetical protein
MPGGAAGDGRATGISKEKFHKELEMREEMAGDTRPQARAVTDDCHVVTML